jgi:hypothetical protein
LSTTIWRRPIRGISAIQHPCSRISYRDSSFHVEPASTKRRNGLG